MGVYFLIEQFCFRTYSSQQILIKILCNYFMKILQLVLIEPVLPFFS